MGQFLHTTCASRVRSIQNYHMDTKRWADIAYNFVVCPHGYVFEGRGWGRRSAANGTNSCNDVYTAVCYLGGQGDPFTAAAKLGFLDVKGEWERRYGRKAQAVPHSNCIATMCPGDDIRKWILAGMPSPNAGEVVNPVPDIPQITGPVEFHMVVSSDGRCTGYYIVSTKTGEIHAWGPGAVFHGRSDVRS